MQKIIQYSKYKYVQIWIVLLSSIVQFFFSSKGNFNYFFKVNLKTSDDVYWSSVWFRSSDFSEFIQMDFNDFFLFLSTALSIKTHLVLVLHLM